MKSTSLSLAPPALREGYAVMSLRYDWPPKRGTSVGLAIGTPASRESELLRLEKYLRFKRASSKRFKVGKRCRSQARVFEMPALKYKWP